MKPVGHKGLRELWSFWRYKKPAIWEWTAHTLLFFTLLWFVYVVFQSLQQTPTRLEISAGDTLRSVQQLTGHDDDDWLLLAISPYCPYSTLSMPFYRKLVSERNDRNIQVIAAVDTSISVEIQKLRLDNKGVSVDSVVALPFHALKIRSVPTVMHLKSDGTVLNVWKGLLDEEYQHDLLSTIGLSSDSVGISH